jgi:hypothetical protein
MNGSPAKLFSLFVTLSNVLIFALYVSPATSSPFQRAQAALPNNIKALPNRAPVRLVPRRSAAPQTTSSAKSQQEVPSKIYKPISPSDGSDGPVAIQSLSDLDSDSVGILNDTNGGLGIEMWQGTSRAFVTRAIAMLPSRVRSPAMRNLMKRLLLSQAVAPKRIKVQPGLLTLRVGALFASGDLKSALALISSTSSRPTEEYLARIGIDGRLFGNDTAGACQMIRAYSNEFKGVYWQQAIAFCLAMAGKTAEAALMSDVLAERSSTINPAFFAAMERLSGAAPPRVESLTGPSALILSLMRSAGLALPEDITEKASPAALRAIALSPNAALEIRLTAAEEAVEVGVLDRETLVEIYKAVNFEDTVLENALAIASKNWDAGGRALLIQAAMNSESAVTRAEIIAGALQLARKKGHWRIMALGFAPLVGALTPSSELAWFSGDAVRILITANDVVAARNWLSFAKEQELRAGKKLALWPLHVLLSEDPIGIATPEALLTWWKTRGNNSEDSAARIRTFFSLINSMGVTIPSELWAIVSDDANAVKNYRPGTSVRNALSQAAAAGSRGGTVVLSLIALGDRGTDPENLSAVEMSIAGLKRVGFDKEAQAIALEIAIEAGL